MQVTFDVIVPLKIPGTLREGDFKENIVNSYNNQSYKIMSKDFFEMVLKAA